MDQAHDVIAYFREGLRRQAQGQIWNVVEEERSLAVFNGWAKDEPFTAIVFVDFATGITDEDMELAKVRLAQLQDDQGTDWRTLP
jgi:hypothetical protein